MAKYTEKVALLEGIELDRKNYLYYVATFPEGVYLCRSKFSRKRKEK